GERLRRERSGVMTRKDKGSSGRLVWFVTGASRGFGLEIARQALERGDAVVATARNPKEVERNLAGDATSLLVVALDVTDEAQARAAAARAVERFGRIDVLATKPGAGPPAPAGAPRAPEAGPCSAPTGSGL